VSGSKSILSRIYRRTPLPRLISYINYKRLLRNGLPQEFEPVLSFLIFGNLDEDGALASAKVEKIRHRLAVSEAPPVNILYSPKPLSSSYQDFGEGKWPEVGQEKSFSMEKVANTGKNKKWGTVLYLLAQEFHKTMGFELGSCAGLSASYLGSAPSMRKIVTVEGSAALADIAKTTVGEIDCDIQVMNCLFSDAIEQQLPELDGKVDFLFIDGHHEKTATLLYFERAKKHVASGAIVVFDDISWSSDMREAWDILRQENEFQFAVDFGSIGVCLYNPDRGSQRPKQWDLRKLLNNSFVGTPKGWED